MAFWLWNFIHRSHLSRKSQMLFSLLLYFGFVELLVPPEPTGFYFHISSSVRVYGASGSNFNYLKEQHAFVFFILLCLKDQGGCSFFCKFIFVVKKIKVNCRALTVEFVRSFATGCLFEGKECAGRVGWIFLNGKNCSDRNDQELIH